MRRGRDEERVVVGVPVRLSEGGGLEYFGKALMVLDRLKRPGGTLVLVSGVVVYVHHGRLGPAVQTVL